MFRPLNDLISFFDLLLGTVDHGAEVKRLSAITYDAELTGALNFTWCVGTYVVIDRRHNPWLVAPSFVSRQPVIPSKSIGDGTERKAMESNMCVQTCSFFILYIYFGARAWSLM